MGMLNDLNQWTQTFAIIFQEPNLGLLRRPRDIGDRNEEFYNQVFGHAVMVLKVYDGLVYSGYRPEITNQQELRSAYYNVGAVNPGEERDVHRKIIRILTGGVPAVISNERQSYQPRHENWLRQTTDSKLVYRDWNLSIDEVRSILNHVEQDKQKEKYYSLRPDRIRESGRFSGDALVHNCVTWIVETVNESLSRQFLPFELNGNASRFAAYLREMGGSR